MHKPDFLLGLSTSAGVAHVVALQPTVGQERLLGVAFQVVFEFTIHEYRQQSAELLPRLAQAMQDKGLTGADCLAIAVDIGPGGFTSLRTACGVAQGLATAWQVPCVPLSSFECMAATFALATGLDTGKNSVVKATCLLDARLQEVYAAEVVLTPSETQWRRQPCLIPYSGDAVAEFTENARNVVVDAPVYADLLFDAQGVHVPGHVLGLGTAALGLSRFQHGIRAEPLACQPMYVREKVAQTTQERRAARDVNL